MKWYAAHLVFYFKLKERKQRSFRVWENVVLIRARNEQEAFAKAEKRGHEDTTPDDSMRWGGHPAQMLFAGVRKLTLCEDEQTRPDDGTEITYLEMDLTSEDLIRRFVAGEPVSVKMADEFAEDDSPAASLQRIAQ